MNSNKINVCFLLIEVCSAQRSLTHSICRLISCCVVLFKLSLIFPPFHYLIFWTSTMFSFGQTFFLCAKCPNWWYILKTCRVRKIFSDDLEGLLKIYDFKVCWNVKIWSVNKFRSQITVRQASITKVNISHTKSRVTQNSPFFNKFIFVYFKRNNATKMIFWI